MGSSDDTTMMAQRIAELEARNAALQAENAELRAALAQRDAVINGLTEKMQAMEARLQAMTRRMFGSSSEKLLHDPHQQSLDLGGGAGGAPLPFVAAAVATEAAAAEPLSPVGAVKLARQRQQRVPADIAVVEQVVDVPAHERIGPDGRLLVRVGQEVAERLHYIPSHFQRLRIVRPIYGIPFADAETAPRVVAAPPRFLVAKGLPSNDLAIQVFLSKYADHLPLYRQSHIWARQGMHLARSTLCGWVQAVANRLRGVWQAIGDEVRAGPYLHLDDTPITAQAKGGCVLGRLWTYGVADAVHLRYTPSRAGCWPMDFLRGYRGAIVADAYAGHAALFADGTRTEIGCWAHVRRKFNDLRDQESEALAMLRRMQGLWAIDQELRRSHADPPAVLARRQRDVVPLLAHIRSHLDRLLATTTPQHPLGRAVRYALRQWPVCERFAYSGHLPLDNNLAERSLRPAALGRKNWLFLGSGEDGGGDWAAIAYSIIGSCALNRLDPCRYLRDIAPALCDTHCTDNAALTPRAWRTQHPHAATTVA